MSRIGDAGGVGRVILRIARGLLALLDVVAIGMLFLHPGADFGHYASYFTIESNVIAIVVLLVGAIADVQGPRWAFVRGGATLYIVITGLIYNTLLVNVAVGVTAAWIDDVIHRAVPALMLLDWIVFSPWARTRYRVALAWLAYPILYLVYTLIRGPIVDWYPYPFVDPRLPGGYGRVALYSVVLTVVFALLAMVINGIGRWRFRGRSGVLPARER